MSNVTALGAHGHNFCSDLMHFRWKKSLLRQTDMVEMVGADGEGVEEMLLHVYEIEDRALTYPKRHGV